ncbi:uncharacterized protein [Choristoneura fumiferana]|uniref:uncharacterized protein n=1 Tax=Choristoneura fumiferana TaxID=7141 RepID=UPI003D158401
MKLDQITPSDDVPLLPAALPLRRPRSPESVKRERHSDDSGSERATQSNHMFGPPGSATANNYRNSRAGPSNQGDRGRPGQGNARDDKPRFGGNQGEGRQNQDGARNARGNDSSRFDNRKQNRDNSERPVRLSDRLNNRSGQDRKFENRASPKEEEWGAKPAPKPDPKPEPKPEPKPVDIPKPKSPAVQLMEPKLQPRLVKEEAKVAKSTPDVVSSSRQLVPKE